MEKLRNTTYAFLVLTIWDEDTRVEWITMVAGEGAVEKPSLTLFLSTYAS